METKDWVIDGYMSAKHAENAANRRGKSGLTGSGQCCGAMNMNYYESCRGWVYETRNHQFLIPGGTVPEKTIKSVISSFEGFEGAPLWEPENV